MCTFIRRVKAHTHRGREREYTREKKQKEKIREKERTSEKAAMGIIYWLEVVSLTKGKKRKKEEKKLNKIKCVTFFRFTN